MLAPARLRAHRCHGIALIEMLVGLIAATAVLAALASGSVSIYKSISATGSFATNIANESRLMDYAAQDLRRAVRVGTLVGGVATPLRTQTNFAITEANILTIDVPDFYASNMPNRSLGSSYKVARYPRTTLNASSTYNGNAVVKLNGSVPWAEAAVALNSKYITRFAPTSAGDGTIQIRYYRGLRAGAGSAVCFYRAEYPSGAGTASDVREIAEGLPNVNLTTSLTISGMNNGAGFRIESSFVPRYRFSNSGLSGTTSWLEVSLRNLRRD